MNDNDFFLGIWRTAGAVLCVIAISIAGCNGNRQYQTRLLIENAKIDPIEAKCALESDTLGSTACILKAMK
jgi:hypothetical protein